MTTQITPVDLQKRIEARAVKVLDGSWALDGTDMFDLYRQDHIPGAQFFDIEAISDHSTDLPHMAPSPDQFANAVGLMGICETDHVVIYDRQGLFSAARVWWTFKLMGHDKVQVLCGGLPAWRAAGLPVTAEVDTPVPATYRPTFRPERIIDRETLQKTLGAAGYCVLDARSQTRFEGVAPEPRAGLRSGHMPGSLSLPFGNLIRDGALKPRDELKAIFNGLDVDESCTVITSCGSGVTAAIISMALTEVGHTAEQLYDGSWSEWGLETLTTPVVTGPAQI
ncbi:3-mercaptopyruvate sulfurtransferase [Asticcacaulis sp. 201]|uniref:3-mercaptopyruvate sulfurtransferase n=1 Tax=Asticcacaulis sp. 201 TaxID=3028787 RepID=UPI002916E08A|nr:3-mercaptopyruvate sulfurtransferase [Asticcacaulis sp. 201]MDV6329395.1 3-mercaptopyruvate sulfurtransferase [Asticcacaulis sp. 201]